MKKSASYDVTNSVPVADKPSKPEPAPKQKPPEASPPAGPSPVAKSPGHLYLDELLAKCGLGVRVGHAELTHLKSLL